MARGRVDLKINNGEVQAVVSNIGMRKLAELSRKIVARAKILAPVDTGNMRNQIVAEPLVSAGTFRVRQTVRVGGSAAEYAVYVHEGTRPHVIRPRNKKVLAFPGASGGTVFAREVQHPGTVARPFLRNAVEAEAPALGFRVTST